MRVYAGTSGFAYPEWRGKFYPLRTAPAEMLPYYATRLSAVEINSTFYRMPFPATLKKWAAAVPAHFRFSLKAPAVITHGKSLVDAEDMAARFIAVAQELGPTLGPVLFQLPPSFHRSIPLLKAFLTAIRGCRSAFEFRHRSWLDDATFSTLADHGCALCTSDLEDKPEQPVVPTAGFGYLRLRREQYDMKVLEKWCKKMVLQEWTEAFVFFRHEESAEGTRLAASFAALAQEHLSGRDG